MEESEAKVDEEEERKDGNATSEGFEEISQEKEKEEFEDMIYDA